MGIVGVKGFVGGFPGSHLPDFGEPSLRSVYRECSREVEALDQGVREMALCPPRIALLHYAPIEATIAGEAAGPVDNVSVPVIGRDFWLFELDVSSRARAPIH